MRHADNYIVVLSGLIIFSPLLDGGTTHIAVMGIRLFIILLGCLFLTRSLRKKMVTWPSLPLDGVVTFYLGLAAVSVALSAYKEASFQWFIILLVYGGLLYLFVYFVDGWEHIATIVAVMAVMGLFEAGLAIHQMSWGRVIRPTGTFFNPNFLAGYLASIGSIALGVLCYERLWFRLPGGLRTIPGSAIATTFMLGGALSLMSAAVVLSGSRAGLLAFLVGIMVVVGIRFGWKGAVILTGFLLSVFVLIPNPVYDRLRAEHFVNPETYARWNIWQSSVSAILDHPSGAGLGLYQYIYPRYAVPIEGMISRYGRLAQTAHNEYLQTGVELGIAGLLVLFWGIGVLFREARLVMNLRLGRRQRGIVIGVVGGVTSILFHAALDSNLHEPAIAIMLILCTGILFSAKQLHKSGHGLVRRQSLESRTVRLLWAGGGTLVAMTLFLGALQPGLAWMAYEDGARAAREKDHDTASARYVAAITLEPGKSLYHSSLAASYFMTFEQTGDPALSEAALRELAIARNLNPLDGRLWGLEGYVYRSLSDHQHVVHAREPASVKQLMDWRALARVAYENAVVLEPFNPMHYLELGRLHLKEGHPERAMAALRQATAVEPNFLPAREWLVRMHLESGETDRAQAEYREILDRRDRFNHAMKNAFEAQFLSVDVNSLEAAISISKGRT